MGILKHGALFIEYVCGSHILKFAIFLKFLLNSNISFPFDCMWSGENFRCSWSRGYKLVCGLGSQYCSRNIGLLKGLMQLLACLFKTLFS